MQTFNCQVASIIKSNITFSNNYFQKQNVYWNKTYFQNKIELANVLELFVLTWYNCN